MDKHSSVCRGLALLLMLLLFSGTAQAVKLGELRLYSGMQEPLRAEIELLDVLAEDLQFVSVDLANRQAFAQAGMERERFITNLQFQILEEAEQPVVRITTSVPIQQTYLAFLLEARSSKDSSVDVREYTALFDLDYLVNKEQQTEAESANTEIRQPQPIIDNQSVIIDPSSAALSSESQRPQQTTADNATMDEGDADNNNTAADLNEQKDKNSWGVWLWLALSLLFFVVFYCLWWLFRLFQQRLRSNNDLSAIDPQFKHGTGNQSIEMTRAIKPEHLTSSDIQASKQYDEQLSTAIPNVSFVPNETDSFSSEFSDEAISNEEHFSSIKDLGDEELEPTDKDSQSFGMKEGIINVTSFLNSQDQVVADDHSTLSDLSKENNFELTEQPDNSVTVTESSSHAIFQDRRQNIEDPLNSENNKKPIGFTGVFGSESSTEESAKPLQQTDTGISVEHSLSMDEEPTQPDQELALELERSDLSLEQLADTKQSTAEEENMDELLDALEFDDAPIGALRDTQATSTVNKPLQLETQDSTQPLALDQDDIVELKADHLLSSEQQAPLQNESIEVIAAEAQTLRNDEIIEMPATTQQAPDNDTSRQHDDAATITPSAIKTHSAPKAVDSNKQPNVATYQQSKHSSAQSSVTAKTNKPRRAYNARDLDFDGFEIERLLTGKKNKRLKEELPEVMLAPTFVKASGLEFDVEMGDFPRQAIKKKHSISKTQKVEMERWEFAESEVIDEGDTQQGLYKNTAHLISDTNAEALEPASKPYHHLEDLEKQFTPSGTVDDTTQREEQQLSTSVSDSVEIEALEITASQTTAQQTQQSEAGVETDDISSAQLAQTITLESAEVENRAVVEQSTEQLELSSSAALSSENDEHIVDRQPMSEGLSLEPVEDLANSDLSDQGLEQTISETIIEPPQSSQPSTSVQDESINEELEALGLSVDDYSSDALDTSGDVNNDPVVVDEISTVEARPESLEIDNQAQQTLSKNINDGLSRLADIESNLDTMDLTVDGSKQQHNQPLDDQQAAAETQNSSTVDVADSEQSMLSTIDQAIESKDQSSMKLDLARTYINLGDVQSAKEMLTEVVQEGTAEQRSSAEKLLLQL